MCTATRLGAESSLTSVTVADVCRLAGGRFDAISRRHFRASLDFDNHASAVARSCNYHARAIRHIRHLLALDLAQTLACSLILSRIDYCNSAARRSIHHHLEGLASPEQRGAYRATSALAVRRQLASSDAAPSAF